VSRVRDVGVSALLLTPTALAFLLLGDAWGYSVGLLLGLLLWGPWLRRRLEEPPDGLPE
jgi:hypothetical protein